ncbi:uncharacterized protein LOC122293498 [Carya illinoinensis]|uniref:uncharacterized protein LOC122293498 n=1 Tax=Carya illinoinensis TaxID=32201 RepID=UPI001C727C66|nr:uncharacterized protein LOC122293498 [Carya illinoinensis]
MISEHDLAMQDCDGDTALHEAITNGNHRMAECLITKNKSLVSVRNTDGLLPLTLAMAIGHQKLARYLYSQTPFEDLKAEQGRDGARLLIGSIYKRDLGNKYYCMFFLYLLTIEWPVINGLINWIHICVYVMIMQDMALDLMERCPRLAFTLSREGRSPLQALAVSTEAFESENRLVFWKRWIYHHCIHISLDRAADQFRLNIQNYQEKTIRSVRADHLWLQLSHDHLLLFHPTYKLTHAYALMFCNFQINYIGFKHLYEMKLVRTQFQELLSRMCEAIPTITRLDKQEDIIAPLIKLAISRGNFEFVCQILKANSSLQWKTRSMFRWAVVHRQHRIFSLAYNLKKRNYLIHTLDNSKNTLLHLAGMLPKYSPIDHIRGAALQMQREVQWFKEVERISLFSTKEYLNKNGLTPNQLFMKEHQNLRKEGEKWMKGTATSCTVVGALIVTIMFTAAFTTPGGNDQDTGLPILVHDKLFKLFIVTDSLSLFSSTTSVLMFLGILTSRYAEEDFLRSLPRKMIIGLSALFFSIATMMIAFSAALLLMLRGKYWIVIPIIGLAGIPIILFVLMQSRLLIDMLVSTYGSGIFDRKMKLSF